MPEGIEMRDQKNIDSTELMQNSAFLRMAKTWETYSKLLAEADPAEKQTLKERMQSVYDWTKIASDNPPMHVTEKLEILLNDLLELSEENIMTPEKVAEVIANDFGVAAYYKIYLSKGEVGKVKEGLDNHMIFLNEMAAYRIDGDRVSFHLRPVDVDALKAPGVMLNGVHQLALLLESEPERMHEVRYVEMTSWTLAGNVGKFARSRLEIDDSDMRTMSEDERRENSDVIMSERLALQYSSEMLQRYLVNGENPTTVQVVWDRDEFISKFKDKPWDNPLHK